MAEISYRLVRSDRKTMGLEITRDMEVLVRAPRWVSAAQIDRFVQSHRQWILRKLAVRQDRVTIHSNLTEEQLATLTQQAETVIPGRVAHFAAIMGLWPTGVRISRARSRFGSCSPKDKLAFSCCLMLYPPEAIDYVVVHELAHIRHKNHGAEFWKTVGETLPDYRQRIKLLRT